MYIIAQSNQIGRNLVPLHEGRPLSETANFSKVSATFILHSKSSVELNQMRNLIR